MIKNYIGIRIDIHSLVYVTNLLFQVDVWDDVVDYCIHQLSYYHVLSALCQNLMCIAFRRTALLGVNSCERGHIWEKASALFGEMIEM